MAIHSFTRIQYSRDLVKHLQLLNNIIRTVAELLEIILCNLKLMRNLHSQIEEAERKSYLQHNLRTLKQDCSSIFEGEMLKGKLIELEAGLPHTIINLRIHLQYLNGRYFYILH